MKGRQLTGFEKDCVDKARERLLQNAIYIELIEQRDGYIAQGVEDGPEFGWIMYQIGFWEGKYFKDVLDENPTGVVVQKICMDLNEKIKKECCNE